MMDLNRTRIRPLALLAALSAAPFLSAATYLPMSDADLAGQAPIIVRASVVESAARLERIGGESRPVTLVTLRRIEAIKGLTGEAFVVALPGGRVGDFVWSVPGTPVFSAGSEVVLMLSPLPDRPGRFRLTELGLSKFDLVTDDAGRRFAVRPVFPGGEDRLLSKRAAGTGEVPGARDADSFLRFLRSTARGEEAPEVSYAAPVVSRAKWANIGGREPGLCSDGTPCLFRWYWDATTQPSPSAVVNANGTQSNLVDDEPDCGTDSLCDVQNAAEGWHGVAATDVRLSGPSAPGNIQVQLDATESQDDGATWNTPLGCSGGVIGLGGPNMVSTLGRTYRGDANFYATVSGTVSMRKVTCSSGYSAATFRAAVLHEVGHVLGLSHPDQDESIHSTTTADQWNAAVMHSVIAIEKPDTPQADDIQAIQYYYGTAAVGSPPRANFAYAPGAPTAGAVVSFSDTSTGGATGWNWDFGDPGSSSNTADTRNATHVFSQPRTYVVKLTAGSLNGSNSISRQVTVAPGATLCTPTDRTLCLNGGRFEITMSWTKTDGSSGPGFGVTLTGDSGYFWFFDRSNVEVVVKVLNACGLGGHYWVFGAGLTDVKATLIVRDTRTGAVQSYENPQSTPFDPIQDTATFSTCP